MQRRGSIELSREKLIIGIVFLVLAVSGIVVYLIYSGRFGGGSEITIKEPTCVGYEWRNYAAENNIVSDYLFSRTKKQLVGQGGDGVFVPTSYTIAGRLQTQEPESSGVYGLSDQAALLKCYVRASDKKNASALKKKVVESFRTDEGSYRAYIYQDGTSDGLILTSSMMEWLDALTEYYVAYGNNDDLVEIKKLTCVIFDADGRIRPENLTIAQYVENPFDGTDVEELEAAGVTAEDVETGDESASEVIEGVLLSSINLRLIRDLENNGLIAEGAYEKALNTVKNGYAGGEYPFYAYATAGEMDCGEYVYNGADSYSIDNAMNVKTMRNLAEVGELDGNSLGELKRSVMNYGRIYSTYNLLNGEYGQDEAMRVYGDAMMIAYYMDDSDMYNRIAGAVGIRVATKSSSPALYMIFREENDRYVFYADENLRIRLATS